MKPKLREIEAHPIVHQGQEMILLRDPLRLSEVQIAVPRPLGLLLALMDGTRDEAALEAALWLRAGLRLAPGLLPKLLADLDAACLLDNERFAAARAEAIRAFRQAPYRPLSALDGTIAHEPEQVAAYLQRFVDALPPAPATDASLRGLISPHIDYQRGGAVYAQVWQAAAPAVREADLVIILGTDHQGSAGTLTLTRQSYATPWGVLPTEASIVESLAEALGPEAAFAEELHHRGEHSIELAAIWLHFIRRGEAVPLVPILCGHFGEFVAGEADPMSYQAFAQAVAVLRGAMTGRRALVVAAADLAHVGPAFGGRPLDFIAQAQLRRADRQLLQTVYAGDATAFFANLKAEGDRRNVCGLPPIYLTLRLLEGVRGEAAGYALCPADPQGLSWVTIAGVILH